MADSTILALDIKDNMVAGVLLLESKRSLKVLAAHCSFLDDHRALDDALGEVVEFCKAGGARCLVSFGAEHFQYRRFHLPFVDRKKARSVIPFEVEDSVSFNEESYLFDYLLEPGKEGGSDVLAALVKKELLQNWLTLLGNHNLDPEVVTISGFPTALNVCRYDQDIPQSCVLLQVGFSTATFINLENKVITAVRSLAYNGQPDESRGADIHYSPDRRKLEIANPPAAEDAFKTLAGEVKNTLFTLPRSESEDQVTSLFIGGLVGALPECKAILRTELASNSYDGNWLRFVDIEILEHLSERWPPGALDDALALACCNHKDRERINFRKEEFAWKHLRDRFSIPVKAGVAALLLLFVGTIIYQVFDYQRMKHRRDLLSDRVIALYHEALPGATPGPEPVKEMQIKVNKLKETASVDSGHDPSLTTVKLMADISARIPENLQVTLERYLYDRKTIRIKGVTDNFNTVDTMKKALEQSPFFSDVSIGSANIAPKEQGVRFELKLQL
jgi:general secretion pathway protein L